MDDETAVAIALSISNEIKVVRIEEQEELNMAIEESLNEDIAWTEEGWMEEFRWEDEEQMNTAVVETPRQGVRNPEVQVEVEVEEQQIIEQDVRRQELWGQEVSEEEVRRSGLYFTLQNALSRNSFKANSEKNS